MSRPSITIITVTFNAEKTLEATIQSVLSQFSLNDQFEYWIIDGNSTDSTVDIIRRNNHPAFHWISEPDLGIYDAMNKGLDRALGEWIFFLGSDDQLEPGALNQISACLSPSVVLVFGTILFTNGHSFRSFFSKRTLLQNTVHHQSAFYHRSLFVSFRYNTKYKIIADYELNLKIYREQLPYQYCPVLVARCCAKGASSEFGLSLKETNQIRARYVKNPLNWMLRHLLGLYYLQKRIRAWVRS